MITIKLVNGVWQYDQNDRLGSPGGFGEVFRGVSSDGHQVAVKRLKVAVGEAGHRELKIANEFFGRKFQNVLAFLDSGIDAESGRYYVVMPLASGSLADHIPPNGLTESESLSILLQIVNGLGEVQELVHRDLKPANILLHEEAWKVADFGIARFVEESTSINTLKGFLSPLYAAPEQWRMEQVTMATDIYALGCIGYTLLTGSPPFMASNREDLRQQHLSASPASLEVQPALNQFLSLCLRKNPQARPSLASVQSQLERILSKTAYNTALAEAGEVIADRALHDEVEATKQRSLEEQRKELSKDALSGLELLINDLFEGIVADAPVARINPQRNRLSLGSGTLSFRVPFRYIEAGSFPNWGVDIVCGALILLEQEQQSYQGRSANLWYGDLNSEGTFRWWEIAYFNSALRRSPAVNRSEPFGVLSTDELRHADIAGSNVMGAVNLAAKPVPIDGEHFDEFVTRWSNRLASAALDKLRHPSHLPED